MAPRKILDEEKFRVVEDIVAGNAVYTLEVPGPKDAMGVETWRAFNTSGKELRAIFEFLIHIGLKQEQQ